LASQGISNLRVGSPILSLLEAAAQSDVRSSQDIFDLLNSTSLDKATGLALIRIGQEEGVPKETETPSTGTVDITDTSFTKLSTKLFQGRAAPIVGSYSVDVADAALWPASGNLYIGRGTSNYEGPLTWSTKTDNGTYWTLTLTAPTTKIHNIGESVILAQGGNRTIGESTIVKTPQANVSDAIEFRTVYSKTIPDGETQVTGMTVVCEKSGIIGNVPAGAINTFASAPFTGAIVTNPLPFSNGRETEDEDSYRERIRNARRTRTKGTALAIKTSVTGIGAVDENKRVTSASLVVRTGYPTTLYIDDGTGYEERSQGQAVEVLVDSALGGEQYFQIKHRPIAKAFLLSRNAAPYLLDGGLDLKVRVGGRTYTHRFDESDFVAIGSASAYEVVASINANEELGFFARTSDSGSRVVLFAKDESNEDLEIIGGTAVEAFRFPNGTSYSLLVYKNDRLLVKDGLEAVYISNLFGDWNTMSGIQTLEIAVDGTPLVTYSFTDQDFIDTKTGYTTVGKNSLAAWATVINAKVPGITAIENDGRLLLRSNAGIKTSASIQIDGGTLVAVRAFAVGTVAGKARDYTVDRNTGQIRLETVLTAGDRLSVGSPNTRSFLESAAIPATTTAVDAEAWFSVDGNAKQLPLGISGASPVTVAVGSENGWGRRLTISTSVAAFSHVVEGDWIVVFDPNLDSSLWGNYRVAAVDRDGITGEVIGTEITIERRSAMIARSGHRTVSLNPVGGNLSKVLTVGGYVRAFNSTALDEYVQGATSAAEIFNSNTKIVTTAASMTRARAFHTATVLNDGRVLITGGVSNNGTPLLSTEIYNPNTNTWSGGPNMPTAVYRHTATKLASGDVLLLGGCTGIDSDGNPTYSTMACRFNASGNTITNFGGAPLHVARCDHQAILLSTGSVLVAGGINTTGVLADCEIYNAGAPSSTVCSSMKVARRDFGGTLQNTTAPLVVGNYRGGPNASTYETYNIGTDAWTIGQLASARPVFFESNDLVAGSGDTRYAMNCWYDTDDGNKVSTIMKWDGSAWTEHSYNPKNLDSYTWHNKKWVEVHTADLATKDQMIGVGGYSGRDLDTSGQLEWYNATSDSWTTVLDAAVTASPVTLSSPAGLVLVRSSEPLQKVTLPAGSNYTATSLASVLNSSLTGATTTVYKTNRLRIATNSFGLDGDIALVAGDSVALGTFKLSPADAIDNLVGHMASVESGNGEAGTPTFEDVQVAGQAYEADTDFWGSAVLTVADLEGGHQLVGVHNAWNGPAATFHRRFGSNLNARLRSGYISGSTDSRDSVALDIRNAPPSGQLLTHERFYAGAPFAIGPEDDLTVQVDTDLNKRYSINMWRKLKPATNVYGVDNSFVDADAGNVSLAETFGLNYPFNDFTVYMKARAMAFSADSARKCLFRYYRLGPDGNYARVHFANPTEPSAPVAVVTNNHDVKTDVRIKLASGAARTPSVRSTTRLAYAATSHTNNVGSITFACGYSTTQAQRTDAGDILRLRIQLPAGFSDCGLDVGSVFYLNSTSGSFTSGAYTVTSKNAASGVGGTQDIFSTDTTAGDVTVGSTIGKISLDSQGEVLFSGAGVVAGDFIRISSNSGLQSSFVDSTFCITTAGTQYLICTSGEVSFDDATVNSIPFYSPLELPANLSIFAANPQSITAIATIVNAAAAEDDSPCPITMVSLGTGAGTVAKSTPDELLSQNWYDLTDGVNWVAKTTSPGSIAGNYTLSLKKTPTGSISTNADWQNEEVRLVPTTTANLVKWLNTPAVSGLYASCIVQASSDAAKLQIASRTPGSTGAVHIQGGLANSAVADIKGNTLDLITRGSSTILRSRSQGFASGMWVGIENSVSVPKVGIIDNTTELQSWTTDGMVTLGSDVYTTWLDPVNAKASFEKQGDFVAISIPGLDQERYKVTVISRDSGTNIYTATVQMPTGLIETGWQVGDYITHDPDMSREIVRAQSVLSGNYFLDLRVQDGELALDYKVGDTFTVTSSVAGIPAGTYTVVSMAALSHNAVRVECTHTTVPAGNLTVGYSIGYAHRADSDFNTEYVQILSITPGSGTQTITWEATALTDVTRNWLGHLVRKVDWSSLGEGDFVRISSTASPSINWADKQVPAQNQGVFRVIRVQTNSQVPGRAGTVWIRNPDVVEGTFEARLAGYDYHSVMPGDLLVVNTPLWGNENRGEWVVEKTGVENAASDDQFVNPKKFRVSLATRTPRSMGNPGALGSQSSLVQIIEATPAKLVKKIVGIAPNQDDPTYVDIRWDTNVHLQQISAQAGSIVTALDKLAFPVDVAAGQDGYNYNTGLIAEANKIVYGDPSDTATYPGVAAAGAEININGPIVKRLKLALQLRVKTGASTNEIANRVRSAVATAVNQIGVGQPVAVSALIAAASKVVGVVSVTMVSPVFNTEHDLISVQPFEKPLVVNLNQDIHITFAGE
jgi:uncharacterized phage protein gp47/JayE